MCLAVNNMPRKAEKDIVVWKVFRKRGFWKPQFVSPYLDCIYIKKRQMPFVELSPIETRWNGIVYHQGYHSFVNKEDAVTESNKFHASVVRKCIIPKSAHYTLGYFNSANDSYVSSTIILCATF